MDEHTHYTPEQLRWSALLAKHGGRTHGPNVETVSISEAQFFALCAELERGPVFTMPTKITYILCDAKGQFAQYQRDNRPSVSDLPMRIAFGCWGFKIKGGEVCKQLHPDLKKLGVRWPDNEDALPMAYTVVTHDPTSPDTTGKLPAVVLGAQTRNGAWQVPTRNDFSEFYLRVDDYYLLIPEDGNVGQDTQ